MGLEADRQVERLRSCWMKMRGWDRQLAEGEEGPDSREFQNTIWWEEGI